MTASRSPPPTSPSRRCRCGSRCRISAASCSRIWRRSTRRTTQTAVFRFAKPTPFQLISNALPALTSVVPKHLYEGTDIAANPANNAPVGTGPFKFAEYKPGEYYRLERNADYWGKGQPYLDEIVYRVLPDRAAAAGALEADEIQLAAFSAVPLADLARIAQGRRASR